jgi:hypothetical protein
MVEKINLVCVESGHNPGFDVTIGKCYIIYVNKNPNHVIHRRFYITWIIDNVGTLWYMNDFQWSKQNGCVICGNDKYKFKSLKDIRKEKLLKLIDIKEKW